MTESGTQDSWLATPERIHAFRQQVETLKPQITKYKLARIEDRTVSLGDRKIHIRIYDPGLEGAQPALVYVHGGCWVAGSLDSHDEVCRYLAQEGRTMVIAIEYRLAPEHPFPAAHQDVFETVGWIWDNADDLGIDRARFALGGESAGAHFAAATAVRTMDSIEAPQFAFLLLIYAALDGGGTAWEECKEHYFQTAEDARSRYGSPLWVDNLSEMPRTFNIFGEHEPSRGEQELFVRKLREAGVQAVSVMNPNVAHDVENWLAVTGNLFAHETAAKFIQAAFAS